MEQLFIDNTMPQQALKAAPADFLRESLEKIVTLHPPEGTYDPETCIGLLAGPTGVAYSLLALSARHPDLRVQGHDLRHWAGKYVEGDRGTLTLEDGCCGIVAEVLALDAVRACVTEDRRHVTALLAHMPRLLEPASEEGGDKFPAEMIYGRAGMLYMLRAVRHWVPDCADMLEEPMRQLSQRIMVKDDDGKGHWLWHGSRYFGAPHGDIGTLAQIVLCVPSLAPKFTGLLEELLALQNEEGNWIHTSKALEAGEAAVRVQYCHGAPGYIFALQSLRPHYPEYSERFDKAIARGREVTWTKGVLKKEPSLCHGVLGNALALEMGSRRSHFLALATPDAVAKTRALDAELFKPANYGLENSALLGYWPSAAWAWSVCEDEEPRMMLFNDI
ncbi:abscisic acid ABA receptor [Purpureocillium lavendulum]|uniref:Abscisic acid ABA receptor n=1 Tax=Purpureocillium lavendulum TaxID=1247861 RepID=A0AB34FX02_9HYPO|nr:abscisic acid ABA receptor [Purpureocillium lavendulum]